MLRASNHFINVKTFISFLQPIISIQVVFSGGANQVKIKKIFVLVFILLLVFKISDSCLAITEYRYLPKKGLKVICGFSFSLISLMIYLKRQRLEK